MLTGILLLSIMTFVGFISYRRPRFEQRVFKKIPLADWITILVIPIVMYVGIILIVINILARPRIPILDFDDKTFIVFGLLFLLYGFVGTSMHFVSKVISRYIKGTNSMVYHVNEIFHGKLSHYLTFCSTLLVIFFTALLEINYPTAGRLTELQMIILILAGLLFGLSSSKAIFYTHRWVGGYTKPLFLLVTVLLLVTYGIFQTFGLDLSVYPVNLFVSALLGSIVVTFVTRQLFILMRLEKRRRLKFIGKILSA